MSPMPGLPGIPAVPPKMENYWFSCSLAMAGTQMSKQRFQGSTDLFLCGLRWEDLVKFKGHGFAFVGEVEDGVVVRVKADHVFGFGGDLLLVTHRPHSAEHPDVAWEMWCTTAQLNSWSIEIRCTLLIWREIRATAEQSRYVFYKNKTIKYIIYHVILVLYIVLNVKT